MNDRQSVENFGFENGFTHPNRKTAKQFFMNISFFKNDKISFALLKKLRIRRAASNLY